MENIEVTREAIEGMLLNKDDEDGITIDRDDFDSFAEFKLADIRNVGLRLGESYTDTIGNYRVNSIVDGKVSIVRMNGKEEIVDLEILAEKTIERYLSNIAQDKNRHSRRVSANDGRKGNSYSRKPFLFSPSSDFYRSLGYLAKNSILYVRILVKDKEDFHEEFFELKGYDPVVEPGVFCILKSNEGTSQFASELSVVVRTPAWDLDTGNIKPEGGKKSTGSKAFFHSADMVWWLLKIGFNVGRPNDIEQIRSSVPDWFKESFDLGLKSE